MISASCVRKCFTRCLLVALTVGTAAAGFSATAAAAPYLMSNRFKVNINDPESSVPTSAQAMESPLEMGYFLMDLTELGDAADKRADYPAAIKFYQALAKAVPDRSVALTKLCGSYELMGDRAKAEAACWNALALGGVVAVDYAHYVHLALAAPALSAPQIANVDAVVKHLQSEAHGDVDLQAAAQQLACELGARLQDVTRLRSCTQQLQKLAPADTKTFAFRMALALAKDDDDAVSVVLADAKRAKLSDQFIALMKTGAEKMQAARGTQHFAYWPRLQNRLPVLAGLLLLIAAAAAWLVARRKGRPTA